MRKALFRINDGPVYIGYTNGYLWNGWATPYFPLEEAQKIQADNNEAVFPICHDEEKDEFYQSVYDEPYIWKGEDIETVDGIKHLYGIGAYSHIWDELGKDEKHYLAEQILELVADIDPYEYRDSYDNEDECLEAILSELDDVDTFYKAYIIMNDVGLEADEIFNKLAEVLHI